MSLTAVWMIFLASEIGGVPTAELSVGVEEVTDTRSTNEFFNRLRIKMKVRGSALSEAWGVMSPSLNKATSDLGENLAAPSTQDTNAFSFLKMEPLNAQRQKLFEVDLKSPARRAGSVVLSGTITVYSPHRHKDESVVIKNYRKHSGSVLAVPELEKRGIRLAFTVHDAKEKRVSGSPRAFTPEGKTTAGHVLNGLIGGTQSIGDPTGHGLSMEINDPKDQILWVQLFDGANKPFTFTGWSVSSGGPVGVPVPADGADVNRAERNVPQRCMLQSAVPLPQNGQLVLYLATDKNIRSLPFSLEVDLP